jgi:hypothetical protein
MNPPTFEATTTDFVEANVPGLSVGRFRVPPRKTRPDFCRREPMVKPFRERVPPAGSATARFTPVYAQNSPDR